MLTMASGSDFAAGGGGEGTYGQTAAVRHYQARGPQASPTMWIFFFMSFHLQNGINYGTYDVFYALLHDIYRL